MTDRNQHNRVHLDHRTYDRLGYFAAGGCASVTSRTITAPLDRLKVYLISQTARKPAVSQHLCHGALHKAVASANSNIFWACRSIWIVGGVRSFWSGNGLNIVKMLPEGATKFGVYEVSPDNWKAGMADR